MSEMAARFAHDVQNHQVSVLRDDGLYRHVRFAEREHSWHYWFELVTWPGRLAIAGDMGSYTFARLPDMFQFFRGAAEPNLSYWAEKVDHDTVTRRYDERKFARVVLDHAQSLEEGWPEHPGPAGLVTAVREWLPGVETYDESLARTALDEFRWPMPADHPLGWRGPEFEFTDTWEWDFRDWTAQFEWCCHAILWGIAQYDQACDAGERKRLIDADETKRQRDGRIINEMDADHA